MSLTVSGSIRPVLGPAESSARARSEPAGSTPATAAPAPPAPHSIPDADARPILAVEQVTLAYGRTTVLQNVNLRIARGDFWCLLGPNGEGKSTLLKALLGAIKPKRGKILLRPDFARRTRIGLVPQESEVNHGMPTTVQELVATGTLGLSLDRRAQESRLKRVLEIMGLTLLRHHSFWTLSGGQRQRTLVARALIRDPLLLIVDEPTAGLDLAAATNLLETITDLSRQKGITVLFVTHDLQIAAQRASHIAFFRQGRVIGGPIDTVFTPRNLQNTLGLPVEVCTDATQRRAIRILTQPQESASC